jgi:thioredoxin reductase
VVEIKPVGEHFEITTRTGKQHESQALIIATGAKPQRLNVPGEEELQGRGLSYSVVSHGALFLGKDVAVVGSGRRAQLAVLEMARYAHHVYLFAPDPLPTDQPLVKTLRHTKNVTIHEQATVLEVCGQRYVEGIVVETAADGRLEVPVKGVFVKLPRKANSELVHDWLEIDDQGRVVIDLYGATSHPGVFAAGDVTHVSEHVLVHIGEGAKVAMEAHGYLLTKWGEAEE